MRDIKKVQCASSDGVSTSGRDVPTTLIVSDAHWEEHAGGIAMSLRNEVEAMLERPNSGNIVCLFRKLTGKKIASKSARLTTLFYNAPKKGTKRYYIYPIASAWAFWRELFRIDRQRCVKDVYIHNTLQAVLFVLVSSRGYVFCYHASMAHEIDIDRRAGKYGRWAGVAAACTWLIAACENMVLRQSRTIVVRSAFMREDLLSRYPSVRERKIVTIPLIGPTAGPPKASGYLRKIYNIENGVVVLLTIRRLTSRMGLENLIRACAELVHCGSKIALIIGGKGHLRPDLERMVKKLDVEKAIKFAGFIAEEEKALYYNAADLFVVPTEHYEGFGLVVLEAWANGCPVLGTPVGALPEVLGKMGDGWLTSNSASSGIASGILRVIRSGQLTEIRSEIVNVYKAVYPRLETADNLQACLSAPNLLVT